MSRFKNIFIIALVTFVIFGCGKKKSSAVENPGSFNQNSIYSAQEKYCTGDEILKEDDFAVDHNFEDISLLSKVVGFSFGDESCALQKSLSESWTDDKNQNYSFGIDIKSRCIANNSLWSIYSVASTDNVQTVALKSLDNSSDPDILMKASKNLKGKYIKDKIGFRVLTCKKSNP